jgi:hypothetical protein
MGAFVNNRQLPRDGWEAHLETTSGKKLGMGRFTTNIFGGLLRRLLRVGRTASRTEPEGLHPNYAALSLTGISGGELPSDRLLKLPKNCTTRLCRGSFAQDAESPSPEVSIRLTVNTMKRGQPRRSSWL